MATKKNSKSADKKKKLKLNRAVVKDLGPESKVQGGLYRNTKGCEKD